MGRIPIGVNMEMKIKNYYTMLINLHGKGITSEEANVIISDDLGIAVEEVMVVTRGITVPYALLTSEYGLVIGRFQPFHFGHEHIINEVILDGKIPIVLIGDDDGKDPKRNPLATKQVQELFEIVYPGVCIFISVKDSKNDWTQWFDDVGHAVIGDSGRIKEQVTLYYYNKEADRHKYFECLNKSYHNEFYTKIFEDNGIKLKEIEFVNRSDIHVKADATNIRDNFEDFKHLLDGRIYWKLKEWGWN